MIDNIFFWQNGTLGKQRHGHIVHLFILQSKNEFMFEQHRFSAYSSTHLDQAVSLNGGGGKI